MSILIKGMEMPTSRGEYGLLLYVDSDGTATVEGSYFRFEGEPFEAVPVPPHGRLIDADAKIKILKKCAADPENDMARVCYNYAAALLDACPTIIPAEEGEA